MLPAIAAPGIEVPPSLVAAQPTTVEVFMIVEKYKILGRFLRLAPSSFSGTT